MFKEFFKFGSNFTVGCSRTIGFYLFPYLLIGFFSVFFPFLVIFIPVLNSCWIEEIEYPVVYTFSIFLGWLYPLYNSHEISLLKPFVMILFQMVMAAVFFCIQLPTWMAIAGVLYVYAFAILFFSPFLINNGLTRVFSEMSHHKQSLTIYFLYLMIATSNKYLVQPITVGLMLGSLYVAYKVLFPKKKV
jgi:hypothetical protein